MEGETGMYQQIYWHAPLWQILLVGAFSLAMMIQLIVSAWRRPTPSEALAILDPILNEQPAFRYKPETGLTYLNAKAVTFLNQTEGGNEPSARAALLDTLLEAWEERRLVRRVNWPDDAHAFLALPLLNETHQANSVLGFVVPVLQPQAEQMANKIPELAAEDWQIIGPRLHLHPTQPYVRVRQRPSVTGEPTAWQTRQLTPLTEALLRHLWHHRGEVQSSEVLFAHVWPAEEVSHYGLRPDQKNRLRRQIHQLRQQIEPNPGNPRYVVTAHGVGYVLYAEESPADR
jgi:hypothetical protein